MRQKVAARPAANAATENSNVGHRPICVRAADELSSLSQTRGASLGNEQLDERGPELGVALGKAAGGRGAEGREGGEAKGPSRRLLLLVRVGTQRRRGGRGRGGGESGERDGWGRQAEAGKRRGRKGGRRAWGKEALQAEQSEEVGLALSRRRRRKGWR